MSQSIDVIEPPTESSRRRLRFLPDRAAGERVDRALGVQRVAQIIAIFAAWGLLLSAITQAAQAGWTVRQWAFGQTRTVRFVGDIENGFNQGMNVCRAADAIAQADHRTATLVDLWTAYRARYGVVVRETKDEFYSLDYTPARLMVMTLWVWRCEHLTPPVREWRNKFEITAPLLTFNSVCEATSAVFVLLLVRVWRDRSARRSAWPDWRQPWRELPAVLAGAALWFNPAVIWDAHVWPQWEMWLMPFFLAAMLACSLRWWITAGVMLALGASFKGQLLMITPGLIALPLLLGDVGGLLRIVAGLAIGGLATAWPWLFLSASPSMWSPGLIGSAEATLWPAGLAAVTVLSLSRGWVSPQAFNRGAFRRVLLAITIAALPLAMIGRYLSAVAGIVLAAAILVGWIAVRRRQERRSIVPASAREAQAHQRKRAARAIKRVLSVIVATALAAVPAALGVRSWTAIALPIVVLAVGGGSLTPVGRRWTRGWLPFVAAVVAVLPMMCAREPRLAAFVVPIALLLATSRWWLPRSLALPMTLLVIATSALATGLFFGGTFDWFRVGYMFPTYHYPRMTVASSNLPQLLEGHDLNWQLHDKVQLPWFGPTDLRDLLITLFAVMLTCCAIAAALHYRRRRPQVLMAMVVPWVLMFTLLPQLHERYLTWAAAAMCVGFGLSLADGLAAIGITFLAWASMAASTLPRNPNLLPSWTAVAKAARPDASWAQVTLAVVCLYLAIVPRGRSRARGLLLSGDREL